MAEDGAPEGQDQEQQQTVEIPLSACPTCKEGDTIPLKVISIDQNGGVINAVVQEYQSGKPGGSDAMAEEVDEDMKKA